MFDRVVKLISENLDIEEQKITMETDMVKDLSVNSIDIINLICVLEEEFKIDIPDRQIKEFMVVGDIVAYLNRHAQDSVSA